MQSPAMTFMMYAIGAYYAIPVVAMMLFTMIFGIVYVAMLAIYWIQRR